MAKAAEKAETGTNGIFSTMNVVSEKDMTSELKEVRSGTGGRKSKYQPIAEFAEKNVTKTKPLRLEGSQNEVAGLRGYLDRTYEDKYEVTSAKKKDGSGYIIYVKIKVKEEEPAEA